MVVQVMRGASAPGEGGDEQGGCTEAAQPISVAGDPVSLGDWRGRRRHVVEEPTPLVEVDEKHRVLPRRARRDRRVNPIEKRFTGTNVVERMVIRTGPGRLARNGGSTYATCGNVPAAQSAKKASLGRLIG